MSRPKKSSTKSGVERAIRLERPPSTVPCMSPETLQHMRECEAREWIKRYHQKIGEVGFVSAQSWWARTKEGISRVRGEEALRSLIKLMEQERAKSRA